MVLGGDHSIAMGTLAGLTRAYERPPGLVWIDAHADINSPQSSSTGNVHGMPLWFALKNGVALAEHATQIGLRDVDPGEKRMLREFGVKAFSMSDVDKLGMPRVMEEAIAIAGGGGRPIHVSFDMDGIDPSEAPGTGTPVKGGLSYREAHLVMEMLYDSGQSRLDRNGRDQSDSRPAESNGCPGGWIDLFGPRQIDSVGSSADSITVVCLGAGGLARAGARRTLAERVTASHPDVLSLSEIDDGDALALATQFGYQWAHRGGQALFWNARFVANARGGIVLAGAAAASIRAARFAAGRRPLRQARPHAAHDALCVESHACPRPAAHAQRDSRGASAERVALRRKSARSWKRRVSRFRIRASRRLRDAGADARGARLCVTVVRGERERRRTRRATPCAGQSLIVACPWQAMPPPQTAGSQLASASML